MNAWLLAQRRVVIVAVVSFVASMCSCVMLVLAAWHQGLDPVSLTGDAKGYLLLAQNLLTTHSFSFSTQAPFALESFRSPGYPFFLALLYALFGNWFSILFVQAAVVSIAPVLLYILFRPYHERAAFWGSIAFAIEPVHLFLAASFLSDALYVCLFLLSLVLLEQWIRHESKYYVVMSGLVLGVSILVRPIGIFLPVLYAGYMFLNNRFSRRTIVSVMLFGVSCMVVIFPWMLRNHANFGSWNISSVGSANLVIYNAPTFLQYHPDVHGQEVMDRFQREQNMLDRNDALSLSRSDVFVNTFLESIHGHEISYSIFHIVKTLPFFVTDGLRDTIRLFNVDISHMPNISTALLRGDIGLVVEYLREGGLGVILLVLGSGFWTTVTLLYGYATIITLQRRLYALAFLFVVPVAYFALLTGPVSNARYRLPIEGILLVAAVFAGVTLVERYKKS